MSRISNYASQQVLNTYLNQVRSRIQDTQVQLTSEKRAQDYGGIGVDTQRLVGYEVDVQQLTNFMRDNDMQDVHLKTSGAALNGIESTVNDFRSLLTSFNTKTPTSEIAVNSIQKQAFQSLQSMQSYLNTEVNGRYVFAGNHARTTPVNLGLSTFEAFQETYDGVNMTYPSTRAMHLEDFNLSEDGNAQTNWLTFTQDSDGNAATSGTSTIAANTAQFSNVTVGSHITVSGTANNNGTYEVAAVSADGKTIDINTKMLTDEALTPAASLTNHNGDAPLTSADFTSLTFNRAAGTVAATTGSLTSLRVGDSFTVAGSAQNDGTYIVETNNGTNVKIKEAKLADEGTTAATVASLTAQDFTFTAASKTIAAGAGTPFS
ncbi:flagellin, partial [Pseudomonadota bacterium]